jgi:hypothetical protein
VLAKGDRLLVAVGGDVANRDHEHPPAYCRPCVCDCAASGA